MHGNLLEALAFIGHGGLADVVREDWGAVGFWPSLSIGKPVESVRGGFMFCWTQDFDPGESNCSKASPEEDRNLSRAGVYKMGQ